MDDDNLASSSKKKDDGFFPCDKQLLEMPLEAHHPTEAETVLQ